MLPLPLNEIKDSSASDQMFTFPLPLIPLDITDVTYENMHMLITLSAAKRKQPAVRHVMASALSGPVTYNLLKMWLVILLSLGQGS